MPYKDRERQLTAQRKAMQKRREDPEYRAKHLADKKEREKELAYRITGKGKSGGKIILVPVETRRALVARAESKCENKNGSCKGALGIHHIDGTRENNDLSNLLLLCQSHHAKEHGFGTKIRGRGR